MKQIIAQSSRLHSVCVDVLGPVLILYNLCKLHCCHSCRYSNDCLATLLQRIQATLSQREASPAQCLERSNTQPVTGRRKWDKLSHKKWSLWSGAYNWYRHLGVTSPDRHFTLPSITSTKHYIFTRFHCRLMTSHKRACDVLNTAFMSLSAEWIG